MLVLRLNILLSIILYVYVFLRMNDIFLRLNMLMIGFNAALIMFIVKLCITQYFL